MIDQKELVAKVCELLNILYIKRFARLEELTLTQLISKNPYLYRALGLNDPSAFIDQLLAARISSSDETIFGNDFLEPLAFWSAKMSDHDDDSRTVTVGSGAGQDIAIETAKEYLAIAVKSGTKIFNSQSTKGQTTEFEELQARLRKLGKQFRPIIGYAYGRKLNRSETKTEKVAGQVFWYLLTGESDYFIRIGQAIGTCVESHAEAYKKAYDKQKLKLLRQFMLNFVSEDGEVLWDAVVKYNSGKDRPQRLKIPVITDTDSVDLIQVFEEVPDVETPSN